MTVRYLRHVRLTPSGVPWPHCVSTRAYWIVRTRRERGVVHPEGVDLPSIAPRMEPADERAVRCRRSSPGTSSARSRSHCRWPGCPPGGVPWACRCAVPGWSTAASTPSWSSSTTMRCRPSRRRCSGRPSSFRPPSPRCAIGYRWTPGRSASSAPRSAGPWPCRCLPRRTAIEAVALVDPGIRIRTAVPLTEASPGIPTGGPPRPSRSPTSWASSSGRERLTGLRCDVERRHTLPGVVHSGAD